MSDWDKAEPGEVNALIVRLRILQLEANDITERLAALASPTTPEPVPSTSESSGSNSTAPRRKTPESKPFVRNPTSVDGFSKGDKAHIHN